MPFIILNSSLNHGTIGRKPQNFKKGSLKGKEKMRYIKVDDEPEKNKVEKDEEEKEFGPSMLSLCRLPKYLSLVDFI